MEAPVLGVSPSPVAARPAAAAHSEIAGRAKRWQGCLGKALMVSRLPVLLGSDRLHLPRTPQAEILAQEFVHYEIRLPPDANDRYGAFSVGPHDDLVTALGLATQIDPVPRPLARTSPEPSRVR